MRPNPWINEPRPGDRSRRGAKLAALQRKILDDRSSSSPSHDSEISPQKNEKDTSSVVDVQDSNQAEDIDDLASLFEDDETELEELNVGQGEGNDVDAFSNLPQSGSPQSSPAAVNQKDQTYPAESSKVSG